jgi:hypothetical protein
MPLEPCVGPHPSVAIDSLVVTVIDRPVVAVDGMAGSSGLASNRGNVGASSSLLQR